MFRKYTAAAFTLCLLLSPTASADALDRLQEFISQMQTFQAGFVQTLYDEDSNPISESKGAVILKRPGKFRWDYRHPEVQSIIADGEKLWIYDVDLETVSVQKLHKALGNAPIMLLSSDQPLHESFDLRDLGTREGLQWVELQPKVQDVDFEKIYLGFSEVALQVMELRDQFGQATQIRFNNFAMNVPVDDRLFVFTPPAGVDVIGDQ